MCMIGDDDGPSFYTASEPRARVAHRCGECRRTIRPGERYERVAGKWDGDVRTYVTCLDCRNGVRKWLEHICGGWLFECVFEDAMEHADAPEAHGLNPEQWDALLATLVCRWAPAA